MKSYLITKYPDIVEEDLEEGNTTKTKNPIKIEIDESKDVEPVNITTPAETPAHLRPAADREIARLIKAGTLEPWEQPAEWSSRGFFVKKATKDGEPTSSILSRLLGHFLQANVPHFFARLLVTPPKP